MGSGPALGSSSGWTYVHTRARVYLGEEGLGLEKQRRHHDGGGA